MTHPEVPPSPDSDDPSGGKPTLPVTDGDDTPDDTPDATLPLKAGGVTSDPASRIQELRSHASAPERYQLRGRVGRGGQGAVYEVWDKDLSRRLAMKVVLGKDASHVDASPADTPPADPETLSRFLEEAQITGQLDHPGVVPIHELGLDQFGHVYFTMRLVKGDDLHTIIRRVHSEKPEDAEWTQVRVLGAVLKACEALAYAHAKKVIHRDLKPSNLMIGKYGEVYVMDWGLARVLGQKDQHDLRVRESAPRTSSLKTDRKSSREEDLDCPLETMDGRVIGTPCYMPPEQAKGLIEEMGPASDVYSMGAVLYQLISGRIPYVPATGKISNHTVLGLVTHGPPTPVAELAPAAPPELVAICEKAMSRSMTDRYPDMESLAADLRAFLEGRVVGAYESGAWAEMRKWIARNRGWAATGTVAFVLLLAALSWAIRNGEIAVTEKERVLRLSDSQLLHGLRHNAEILWPAHPSRIEEYKAWLSEAERIRARVTEHERNLSEIRERATQPTEEQLAADRTSHPDLEELERETNRLHFLRRLLVGLDDPTLLEEPPIEELLEHLTAESFADAQALESFAWPRVSPSRRIFGEENLALTAARRKQQIGPADPGGLDTLAWALLAAGRLNEAVEASRNALRHPVPGT